LIDLVLRFLMGGIFVSTFALAGDVLKPRSFAGIFGAAPSVALATLALTIASQGADYASLECRSMVIGALALGAYSWVLCRLLIRRRADALRASLYALLAWFLTAFGFWYGLLR
jgi:hypothetical protein